MKKTVLALVAVILIAGSHVCTAGDLVVNGKLSVGTSSLTNEVNIESTDLTALDVKVIKNSDLWLNGIRVDIEVNSSNAGSNTFVVCPSHVSNSSTSGTMRGALFNTGFEGAGTLNNVVGM